MHGTLLTQESTWPGWIQIGNSRVPILAAFRKSALPVRHVRFCDEIKSAKIRHTGWYVDDDQCMGTIRGVVAYLPHGKYLIGYYESDNGEYVIRTDAIINDESDAARWADGFAEGYAEECREHNARFRAMVDAEGLTEEKEREISDAWQDYRAIWSAFLADPRKHWAAAKRAQESVRELIADLRAARREEVETREAYE